MRCIIGTHVSHLHIRIVFGSLYQIGFHFKALARKINEQFQTVAYKLDNISYSHRDYNVGILSVKELEEITGFTFFPDKPEITESIKSQKTSWK